MSNDTADADDQQQLAAIAAMVAEDQKRIPSPPEGAVLAATIAAQLDAAVVAQEASEARRAYLGASSIGQECERALWYAFRWYKRETFPPRILRRFDRGHREEARVFAWLEAAGYEVRSHNPRARNSAGQFGSWTMGGMFGGHVDGFVRGLDLGPDWCLLEVKAMGSARYRYHDDEPIGPKDTAHDALQAERIELADLRARVGRHTTEGPWWRLKRRGLKKERPDFYAQVQSYMALSHPRKDTGGVSPWGLDAPLARAIFVAVNTDTDQLHIEVVDWEPAWWRRIQARARRILRSSEPPARVAEIPAFPPCSFCAFRGVCHGVEPPDRNCRTCVLSEIRMPGDRGVWGDRAQWFCTLHRSGLGDYTACNDWRGREPASEF